MLTLDRRESLDVEFHDVAIAVAQMLARQMDDTFLGLIYEADPDPNTPHHHAAEVANRIVVLCRRLVEEIQRYQRWDQLRREQEHHEDEDLPF